MRRALWIGLALLLLVGLLPLILSVLGSVIAGMTGCDFSAGPETACMIMGVDLGSTLYTMMMMHWFALLSLPLAGIAVIGLIIMGLIALIRRMRR